MYHFRILEHPPPKSRALVPFVVHELGSPALNHSPEASVPLSSYRPLSYSSGLPNWGSRRQLLIVYSGKSSALTENHLFFGRKYQFFRRNHTLSPKRGALMRYPRPAIRTRGEYGSSIVSFWGLWYCAEVLHGIALHGIAWYCIGWYCMVLRRLVGCVEERDPRAAT